eukprot:TRINITY_DN20084_c0_g1_i1.p1 TRINITY_DN20084_c0_g1~~TRINITY_DN20084_c0_g1_i1.p1  ORF type:complete len:312 (-),score=49.25 TRINITY_DN20084_c0_g1_i1:53-988(-)
MTAKSSLLLLAIAIISSYAQNSCREQWDCSDFADHYSYIACVEGLCSCKPSFSGNATAESPCACADGAVYWGNDQPFCKHCGEENIYYDSQEIPHCADVAACEDEDVRAAHQKAVITQLYSQLVYPMPLYIMQNPALSQVLFASNVRGRITPVGVFSDFEGTLEYFYALAAAPGGSVESVKFIELFSSGDRVAVRVDILFNTTTVSGPQYYNLTETGFFRFNQAGLIETYDLSILRLGKFADVSTADHPLYVGQVCTVAQMFCNGTYQQYDSFEDCVNFLSQVNFGSWNDAQSNTTVCRVLHSIMVPKRPE